MSLMRLMRQTHRYNICSRDEGEMRLMRVSLWKEGELALHRPVSS